MACGRSRRCVSRFGCRSTRRLHPFLDRRAGRRDRGQTFRRTARLGAGRGGRRRVGPGAQMGTLPRQRSVSASLCCAAAVGGALGAAVARRGRWSADFSGANTVIGLLDRLARPFLRALDPEGAHGLAIKMLKFAPLPSAPRDDRRLALRVFGLNFPNPIGIAAGFDKNAEVPDALLRLGFGFVEVGTITPKPQPGNPRPRLFRLDTDQGVINRLGFNSQGADAALRRLAARAHGGGVVGINVGANKDAPDRIADYVGLIERFAAVASY